MSSQAGWNLGALSVSFSMRLLLQNKTGKLVNGGLILRKGRLDGCHGPMERVRVKEPRGSNFLSKFLKVFQLSPGRLVPRFGCQNTLPLLVGPGFERCSAIFLLHSW